MVSSRFVNSESHVLRKRDSQDYRLQIAWKDSPKWGISASHEYLCTRYERPSSAAVRQIRGGWRTADRSFCSQKTSQPGANQPATGVTRSALRAERVACYELLPGSRTLPAWVQED